MKVMRILIAPILIVIGVCFLPGRALAAVCYANTDIVYGNGMYNDRKDAVVSLLSLRNKILFSPQSYSYRAELEFYLAYTDNNGAAGPSSLVGLAQLYEAFVQKQAANDSSFWRWLGDIAVAPAWFKASMNDMAANTNSNAYVNDATLQQQLDGDPSNPSLQPGYRTLLKRGDRIVIVAHSQGNFYANAAYDVLVSQSSNYVHRLGIVAVASPDNRVAGGGQYITVPEDVVIAAIRFVYPLTLASSPVSGSSPNMAELGQATYDSAAYGHSFVQWYLAGSYTRNFIMDAITQTTQALQAPFKNSGPAITSPAYSWNAFANASRCVVDEVNRLGFSVDTYSNGYVFISVAPLLGTMAQPATHSSVIPPVQSVAQALGRQAIAILPIPSGVGIVYSDASESEYYSFDIYSDDLAISGTTTMHLISYIWHKTTGMWSEQTTQLDMPQYSMNITNYFCPSLGPSICSGPMAYNPISWGNPFLAYYSPVVYQNALYDYGGEMDSPGFESELVFAGYVDDHLTAPWLVVSVKNGQLSTGPSGVFTLSWDARGMDILPATIDVGVPGYIRLHGYEGANMVQGIQYVGVTTQ